MRPSVRALLFPRLLSRGRSGLFAASGEVGQQSFFPSAPTWTEGVDQRGLSWLLPALLSRCLFLWWPSLWPPSARGGGVESSVPLLPRLGCHRCGYQRHQSPSRLRLEATSEISSLFHSSWLPAVLPGF